MDIQVKNKLQYQESHKSDTNKNGTLHPSWLRINSVCTGKLFKDQT